MFIKYPLYNLLWQEFEELVVLVCDRILGTGVINFSEGKDGGRDAFFTGKAQNYPSKSSPWEGVFVIQAKHTERANASCSDSDFKTILEKETTKRVNGYIKERKVSHYLIFTNRKLPALADAKISDFTNDTLNINNRIIGLERIQLWLKDYPDIPKKLDLDNLLLPLQFYEKDIKNVVMKFAEISENLQDIIEKEQDDFRWLGLEKKNEINRLSEDYFKYIQETSMSYFAQIEIFLKDPKNKTFKEAYINTTLDLQEKIIINRSEYDKFEKLLSYIYDYIIKNNLADLKEKRGLVRIFLHYMYCNCDIGLKDA